MVHQFGQVAVRLVNQFLKHISSTQYSAINDYGAIIIIIIIIIITFISVSLASVDGVAHSILAGELSLSHARPSADGTPHKWSPMIGDHLCG